MNRRIVNSFFLVVFCYYASTIVPANIIFDLGGVLLTQPLFKNIREIGPLKFVGLFNPVHIEDSLMDFLDSVDSVVEDGCMYYPVHKNRRMPNIMRKWLMGMVTSEQVRALVLQKLDELAPGIDSHRKVQLMREIINFMFTPERLIKVTTPIKRGVKILKKCYHQRDSSGNRVHRIFILTNWDKESFPLLYENRQIFKFLNLCDGIVVSGMVQHVKPDPEIFEGAFAYFGIDPDHELTCYIDDELCNIRAARTLGKRQLKCIHCAHFDFDAVEKDLIKLGIYS